SAQNTPDIRPLQQGKPVERQLAGGETDVYSIQMSTGQFLSVIVDQRGIDVAVTLFGPDGKQIEAIDSPTGTTGPEPVSVLAKALNVLGWTQNSQQAKITYLLELKIAEQVGYRKGISKSLNNLAVASNGVGDLKQASEYLQKSLSLIDPNDKNVVAITLINI